MGFPSDGGSGFQAVRKSAWTCSDFIRGKTELQFAGLPSAVTGPSEHLQLSSGYLEDVLRAAYVQALGFQENAFAVQIEGGEHGGFARPHLRIETRESRIVDLE